MASKKPVKRPGKSSAKPAAKRPAAAAASKKKPAKLVKARAKVAKKKPAKPAKRPAKVANKQPAKLVKARAKVAKKPAKPAKRLAKVVAKKAAKPAKRPAKAAAKKPARPQKQAAPAKQKQPPAARLVAGLMPSTVAALDEIRAFDWGAASKGSASEVGDAALALASPVAEKRKAGREQLFEQSDHPVLAILAPWLVRLFEDEALPERVALLRLLVAVGVGPQDLDMRFEADTCLAQAGRTRRIRYQAAAAVVSTAVDLLEGEEEDRAAAAELLAWFPEPAARARLREILSIESSPLVLSVGLLALGLGGDRVPAPEDAPLCSRFLDHANARVSLAAAVAASFLVAEPPEAVLARIESALDKPVEIWPGYPWGELQRLAIRRYIRLADRCRDRVVAHLPAALDSGSLDVAAGLLRLVFSKPLQPGDAPNDEQAKTVREVLSRPALVNDELPSFLHDLGLPRELDEVRDLVGIPPAAPDEPLLSRPVIVAGQTQPFYLAWQRMCWGKLPPQPIPLVDQALAGLDAGQALTLFRATCRLPSEISAAQLRLPELPGAVHKQDDDGDTLPHYQGKVSTEDRGQAEVALLCAEGWRLVYAWDNPPRDYTAHLVRDGLQVEMEILSVWSDDLGDFVDDEAKLSFKVEPSPGRLFAPTGARLLGQAFTDGLEGLAAELGQSLPQKDIRFAWEVLVAGAVLAEEKGQPPAAVFDGLFKQLHVSWIPMPGRASYLRVCPPERAEALALWMLKKEPGNAWLTAIVDSPKVKKAVKKSQIED
jgi:hypothetical protein